MKSENSRLRAAKEEKKHLHAVGSSCNKKGLFTPAPEGETALRLSTRSQISSDVLEETLSSPPLLLVRPLLIWRPPTVTV